MASFFLVIGVVYLMRRKAGSVKAAGRPPLLQPPPSQQFSAHALDMKTADEEEGRGEGYTNYLFLSSAGRPLNARFRRGATVVQASNIGVRDSSEETGAVPFKPSVKAKAKNAGYPEDINSNGGEEKRSRSNSTVDDRSSGVEIDTNPTPIILIEAAASTILARSSSMPTTFVATSSHTAGECAIKSRPSSTRSSPASSAATTNASGSISSPLCPHGVLVPINKRLPPPHGKSRMLLTSGKERMSPASHNADKCSRHIITKYHAKPQRRHARRHSEGGVPLLNVVSSSSNFFLPAVPRKYQAELLEGNARACSDGSVIFPETLTNQKGTRHALYRRTYSGGDDLHPPQREWCEEVEEGVAEPWVPDAAVVKFGGAGHAPPWSCILDEILERAEALALESFFIPGLLEAAAILASLANYVANLGRNLGDRKQQLRCCRSIMATLERAGQMLGKVGSACGSFEKLLQRT